MPFTDVHGSNLTAGTGDQLHDDMQSAYLTEALRQLRTHGELMKVMCDRKVVLTESSALVALVASWFSNRLMEIHLSAPPEKIFDLERSLIEMADYMTAKMIEMVAKHREATVEHARAARAKKGGQG